MANDPTPIRGGTPASPGRIHQKWYHLFLRIMALFDTVVAVRKARAKFGTEKFERLFRTTAELRDAELEVDHTLDNPANNPFHRVLPGTLRGKPGVDIKRWQKKRREHQESTFYTVGSRISDGGGTKRAPQEHCHHPNYEMELGETGISLYPDEGWWTCNRCQARWSAESVQKYQWTGDEPAGNERCMFGVYAGYTLATLLKKDPLYCREVMRGVRSGEWPQSGFFRRSSDSSGQVHVPALAFRGIHSRPHGWNPVRLIVAATPRRLRRLLVVPQRLRLVSSARAHAHYDWEALRDWEAVRDAEPIVKKGDMLQQLSFPFQTWNRRRPLRDLLRYALPRRRRPLRGAAR